MSFNFGSEQRTGSLLSQMGLMNLASKFSTGNAFYDVLMFTAVPFVASSLIPAAAGYLYDKLWTKKWKYTRNVVFRTADESIRSPFGPVDDMDPPPTSLLQQAILSALNKRKELFQTLRHADVQLGFAPRNVEKGAKGGSSRSGRRRRMDPYMEGEEGAVQPLQLAAVSVVPEIGTWVEVTSGVFFQKSEFVELPGEHTQRAVETIFCFASDSPNGNVLIDNFIKAAFEEYQREQREAEDSKRYLYIPVSLPPSSSTQSGDSMGFPAFGSGPPTPSKAAATPCKRYALNEDKTFDTFFHPEKDIVLKLVNDFQKREGKFAIPGYPRKLGFLLHGPPGTGKTSFIKALAQFTRRNIVSIPLALIETNQALMDIMFNQQYAVADQQLPIVLPFENSIFVLEDVDAAGDVVHRRAPADADAVTTSWTLHKDRKNDTVELVQSSSFKSLKLHRNLTHTSSRGPNRSLAPSASRNMSRLGVAPAVDETKGLDSGGEEEGTVRESGSPSMAGGVQTNTMVVTALPPLLDEDVQDAAPAAAPAPAPAPDPTMNVVMGLLNHALDKKEEVKVVKDALNLSGLLNALDGVVDTPGRIIVMTSNHPEKLDPALTRPGRINRHIFMGRLKYTQAVQMTEHYFPDITAEEREHFTRFWVDECWTPAELEALCGQCDTVGELLTELQAKTGVGLPHTGLFDQLRQTNSA